MRFTFFFFIKHFYKDSLVEQIKRAKLISVRFDIWHRMFVEIIDLDKMNIGINHKTQADSEQLWGMLNILHKCPNLVPGSDLSQVFSQINPSDLGISPLNGGDQFDK